MYRLLNSLNYNCSDSVSRLPTSRKVWGREGRITDKTDADQGSTEVREGQISEEEDQNRKQLISALFGGIASRKVKVTCGAGTYV
jgi:hypothetical protein